MLDVSRASRILVATPVRNEESSLRGYLNGLVCLDYPFEAIDLRWLENDSSDATLDILKAARRDLRTRGLKVSLTSVELIGPQSKRSPGEYVKDVPYGKDRIGPWLRIWNDHFIPWVRQSDAEFFVMWMADCVPPPHTFKAYLGVFREYLDAGWVGGAMHRRHPKEWQLFSPWLIGRPRPRGKNARFTPPNRVTEVNLASPHCCMIRADLLREGVKASRDFEWDVHMSVANGIRAKGFRVYYTPEVYLQHVSSDSKIYRKELKRDE